MHKHVSNQTIEQMSLDELVQLRDRADQAIGAKLISEKKAIQEKLSAIEQYERRGLGAQPVKQQQLRSKPKRVAPKYRDPSSGETWAGRGQMPRWMAKRVAQGATPEDFLIAGNDRG